MQARRERQAAVYFFDATFSVPKSVSLLHASLQVRAYQARGLGLAAEADRWDGRAEVVLARTPGSRPGSGGGA